MNSLATVLSQQGIQAAAVQAELSLSAEQIRSIAQTESACVERAHRVQFGQGAAAGLVRELGVSAYLTGPQVAQTLEELVESFYDLREDLPAHISDAQITETLRLAFDGEAAGDPDLAASQARELLLKELQADLTYQITDDDGNVYSFDPEEWHDDVLASGWLGERWDQGLDEGWDAVALAGEGHE